MKRNHIAICGVTGAMMLAALAAFAQSTVTAAARHADPVVVVPGRLTFPMAKSAVKPAPLARSIQFGRQVTPAISQFSFGVQTHFSQGWNPALRGLAGQVGATTFRDTVSWASAERRPGVYEFSGPAVRTLTDHCATGGKLILTIVQKNVLYDGGRTVYSSTGQAAYAAYVKALLGRFPGCISAIEVGNEINGANALDYPTGMDRARTYVASLQVLNRYVKPSYPNVAILGGSTNAVGTGFLKTLFAAGALSYVDGIAVHPYRGIAEGLDLEINHLRDVMRDFGTPVGIWATEFSYDTPKKADAAAGLVKSAVLLNASGVDHASWYALVDQRWFPNMGLFAGTAIKPTGLAFAAINQRLFPFGRAQRVDAGDNLVYLYRFGRDRWLVWGAARSITFFGAPVVSDMYGTPRSGNTVQITAEPVIVEGATSFSLAEANVVADTLLQYGSRPWSYWRRGADGRDVALALFDNDFTTYLGDRWSKPLRINATSAAPAGTGRSPMRAVIRYTAPAAQQVDLDACLSKTPVGDGVDYNVVKNGEVVVRGILTAQAVLRSIPLNLARGDTVDLVFGPNQTFGGDGFRYRARLTYRGRGTPLCS